MWCSRSQCRSRHVVAGSLKPKQKRGHLSSLLIHAPTIVLSRHGMEKGKMIIKLPCVLSCPGKADSRQSGRERKLEETSSPEKESRVCDDVRIYPWVSVLVPSDHHKFQLKWVQPHCILPAQRVPNISEIDTRNNVSSRVPPEQSQR